jgi:crotonobetainyl-CoA:carnitine CoA-transferase CaiB-like acyl-CoA transferase
MLDREEYIELQYANWDVQQRMFGDLDALFARHTLAEWLEFFGDVEVCVGPALGLGEALEMRPNLGFMLDQPGEGGLRQLGGLFGATANRPAPALGEHTDAALAALGLGAAEIVGLRVMGAV